MRTKPPGPRPLREIEMEVVSKGREWIRQKLQQRFQAETGRYDGERKARALIAALKFLAGDAGKVAARESKRFASCWQDNLPRPEGWSWAWERSSQTADRGSAGSNVRVNWGRPKAGTTPS